jgi:hypothetical protein
LLAVGVAFEVAARLNRALRDEISVWAEGFVFSLGVLPHGPSIAIKKTGRGVRCFGKGLPNPNVAILFKNIDGALLVFLGRIGTPVAAAQRRFIVHGPIAESSQVARTLAIVQSFLFPRIVVDKTYRRPPRLGASGLPIKAAIYLALVPGLILRAVR